MSEWLKKLIADKDGNPNEHVVAAVWGSLGLLIIAFYLCFTGHGPTLTDFGMAHGSIWASAGIGQKLSGSN